MNFFAIFPARVYVALAVAALILAVVAKLLWDLWRTGSEIDNEKGDVK